eukprot:1155956-Pelagomonas_calceolata.AAC.10
MCSVTLLLNCSPLVKCYSRKRPKASDWDAVEPTPAVGSRWEATPGLGAAAETPAWGGETPGLGAGRWDATPGGAGGMTPGGATPGGGTSRRNRWDTTPAQIGGTTPAWGGETPAAEMGATQKKGKSRWDETPAALGPGATPAGTCLHGVRDARASCDGMQPGATPAGTKKKKNRKGRACKVRLRAFREGTWYVYAKCAAMRDVLVLFSCTRPAAYTVRSNPVCAPFPFESSNPVCSFCLQKKQPGLCCRAGGVGITPGFFTGATPAGGVGMETPAAAALQKIQAQVPMTPEQYQEARTQVGMECVRQPYLPSQLERRN